MCSLSHSSPIVSAGLQVPLEEGLGHFAAWFYSYYGADGTNLKNDEVNYHPAR